MGMLYGSLYLKGRYKESIEAMKLHYMNFFKDFKHAFDQYEKLGYIGTLNLEIDTLLAQSKFKFLPPIALADLYLYTGNKEKTLECLEHVYKTHDPNLPGLITGPDYDILSGEPRFQKLLRKLNLPRRE
jgi:hypothetical protein